MLGVSGPTLGSPRWAGDFLNREHLIPGGANVDPAQFIGAQTGTRVTLTANAGAGSVALTVGAGTIKNAIPAGAVLDFGTTKLARTSAAVAAGAVSIPVDATPTAMVIGDTAVYSGAGKKNLPSGTIVGRTRAEAAAGTPFGAPADTDEEFFLTAFDVTDVDVISEIELYRPNSVVYENFLPDFAGQSAAVKAAIRLRYLCTVGQA
jgi:hypothetical protein